MAGSGSSMLYSFLLFIATLSLQEVFRGKLASSELYTILGGFTSSLIFILLLTFIGNYQETAGVKTGWGAVILAEIVALIAAGTVHRVCITTCLKSLLQCLAVHFPTHEEGLIACLSPNLSSAFASLTATRYQFSMELQQLQNL